VFERAGDTPLAEIWYGGAAFNAFRGTDWMREPCASCALKELDFGGCRCQALALAGDAAATDPVCHLSPRHHDILHMAESESRADVHDFVYRRI
jgi:pyrroloquinoline quinone biosynthesis protein E